MTATQEDWIKSRKSLGWQPFGGASSIFESKMSQSLKNLYNQWILSIIIYEKNIKHHQENLQPVHGRILFGIIWKDQKQRSESENKLNFKILLNE